MARIFITGDTHGDIDIGKVSVRRWPLQKELTKEDYLIILGDAGLVWYNSPKDNYIQKWWQDKPFTTLFVDGNHENHEALAAYPVEVWKGGKIHRIRDSVFHLMRGQVFTIEGLKFFTMGGADSVDKAFRHPFVSWWPQELPSVSEYDEALANLAAAGMQVDYVLTHDCGAHLYPKLCSGKGVHAINGFFDRLEYEEKLQFRHWYFGHHHRDLQLDGRHTVLYDKIIEIPGCDRA